MAEEVGGMQEKKKVSNKDHPTHRCPCPNVRRINGKSNDLSRARRGSTATRRVRVDFGVGL